MTEDVDAAITDDLHRAISDVFARHGRMVGHFVFAGEEFDPSEGRSCWTLADVDAKSWDVLGLLHYALESHTLGAIASHLGRD